MSRNNRSGFSVLEAIIVLAISGTALLLVFEMGVSGSQRGFRLGNRALAAADADPGAGSLRAIIRGARFDSAGRAMAGARGPIGDARVFSTPVSVDRATVCGPAGPGSLQLALTPTPRGDLLTCSTGRDNPPRTLLDLRPSRGRFAYSDDAVVWRESWARRSPPPGRRLYVRLTSPDGRVDIVEVVDFEPDTPGARP